MLMVKKNHLFMFLLVLIPSTLDLVDGDAEGLAGVACIIGFVGTTFMRYIRIKYQ